MLIWPLGVFAQDKAEDYYRRAYSAFDRGDLDSALADYSRAIELAPSYSEAYAHSGILSV